MILRLFPPRKAPPPTVLSGERLYLRPPEKQDGAQWLEVRRRNAAAQAALSPVSAFTDLTNEGYARRFIRYRADWRDDHAYIFFIFLNGGDKLAGGLTLNNIVRGAGQMATLGYWLDEDCRGQGLMPEAVNLACGFAFEALGLHRVQAGCLPHNMPSRRVLEKCGFTQEGIARKYIQIAGEWQDHVIYAKVVEDEDAAGNQ